MSTATARLVASTDQTSADWNAIRSNLFHMDHKLDAHRPRFGIRRFEHIRLPDLDVFRDDGIGQRYIVRSQHHIQMDEVKDFMVTLPLTSHVVLRQGGVDTFLDPGSFSFLPTATPFVGTLCGANNRTHFSQILARVPGAYLRELLPTVDAWPVFASRIRPGAGRLMASMLQWALNDGTSLSPSQAALFSRTLLEAIVGALVEAPETKAFQPAGPTSAHAHIREMAMAFISRHLSNPMLDVAMVARHCKVSERYLHAAFASASIKVGACIRLMRLEQCRAALLNPAHRSRSITEIALRWGFIDPNSFGRAYKAWCGKTPREERAALQFVLLDTLKTS